MLKLIHYFLWLVVIIVLAVSFDQLMVKVPLKTPGLIQTQQFYVDFRQRLIGLFSTADKPSGDTIDNVISDTTQESPQNEVKRYLYVDANGNLQFADSLKNVPERFRKDAQPLAE